MQIVWPAFEEYPLETRTDCPLNWKARSDVTILPCFNICCVFLLLRLYICMVPSTKAIAARLSFTKQISMIYLSEGLKILYGCQSDRLFPSSTYLLSFYFWFYIYFPLDWRVLIASIRTISVLNLFHHAICRDLTNC